MHEGEEELRMWEVRIRYLVCSLHNIVTNYTYRFNIERQYSEGQATRMGGCDVIVGGRGR